MAGRGSAWLISLALGAAAVGAGAGAVAYADNGPSAGQVAAAAAREHQLAGQLAATQADLARVQARLSTLDLAAGAAVEAYDGAEVRLQLAERTQQADQLLVSVASHRLATARDQVNALLAATYMSGGLSSLPALLLSPGGPQTVIDKAATMDVLSGRQQALLTELTAAGLYLKVVERQAAAAVIARRAAATAATAALRRAQAQVAAQGGLLRTVQRDEQRLHGLYIAAANRATALAEQRARAVAEAKAAARARAIELARAAAARAAAAAAAAQAAAAQAAAAGQEANAASAAASSAPSTYTPTVSGPVSDPAAIAVEWAYRELGKPYVYGAAGPDAFDCSGLTMFVYAQAGITLLHYTGYQWNEGVHVSEADLEPGDLVFFYPTHDHVGIYVGNGDFIAAPHTGSYVQVFTLASGWYAENYVGAVRPY